MKKLLSLALCLLLAALSAAPALADVLWEPADDFYFAHFDECVPSDGAFLVQEDTVLWKSPADGTPTGTLEKGTSVETPYIWTDENGDTWGYAEYRAEDGWVQGWINLSHPASAPSGPRTVALVIDLIVIALSATALIIIVLLLRKNRGRG